MHIKTTQLWLFTPPPKKIYIYIKIGYGKQRACRFRDATTVTTFTHPVKGSFICVYKLDVFWIGLASFAFMPRVMSTFL